MLARRALIAAALIAAPALLAAQTPTPPAPPTPATATTAAAPAQPTPVVHPKVGNEIELGRLFTGWLYAGRFDSLFTRMDLGLQVDLGSVEKMAEEFDQFTAQVGEETSVVDEKVVMRNGNPQYWRTANFSRAPEPIMIRWAIVDGMIVGIGINPASRPPEIDPVQ